MRVKCPWRRSSPLLDGGFAMSDSGLEKTQTKMSDLADKVKFTWVSLPMVFHACAATGLSAAVYLGHSVLAFPLSPGAFLTGHVLLGAVLGLLLVGRIVIGMMRVQEAASYVQDFNKNCRQMAVLSSFVNETLTVSAAAEVEKKATGKFRFEMVRLLNLAFYSYQLMLNGMKMYGAPETLKSPDGGKLEAGVLSAVDNPTVMVCKMIAALLEQQRAAKRISNEQVAVLMSKVSDLIESYHKSLSLQLAPAPSTLSSFAFSFTVLWAYTLGPIIAINELDDNSA